MSNIKDICCNLRLHDLVLARWSPFCELYDAEVVRFLPLFAFHAMKSDEEPAKLACSPRNLLVLKKANLTTFLHFTG